VAEHVMAPSMPPSSPPPRDPPIQLAFLLAGCTSFLPCGAGCWLTGWLRSKAGSISVPVTKHAAESTLEQDDRKRAAAHSHFAGALVLCPASLPRSCRPPTTPTQHTPKQACHWLNGICNAACFWCTGALLLAFKLCVLLCQQLSGTGSRPQDFSRDLLAIHLEVLGVIGARGDIIDKIILRWSGMNNAIPTCSIVLYISRTRAFT